MKVFFGIRLLIWISRNQRYFRLDSSHSSLQNDEEYVRTFYFKFYKSIKPEGKIEVPLDSLAISSSGHVFPRQIFAHRSTGS